jgi:hypothetical protein
MVSQTEFVGALGQRSVIFVKLGLSWESRDRWDPYAWEGLFRALLEVSNTESDLHHAFFRLQHLVFVVCQW